MGRDPNLRTAHFRATLAALTFGMLVVARTQSLAAAAALTLIGVAAARRTAARGAIAALGVLTLCGTPWIASALMAGALWLALAYRRRTWGWLSAGLPALWGVGGVAAVVIGFVAGLVAAPFSREQANLSPIVFDIAQPPGIALITAVALLALANSIGEEFLWRGALNDEALTMPVAAQYVLQFCSFGLAHWHGLPGGWSGVLLTGLASVLFLWIHRRWGICASILAHLIADLLIFTAVLPLVLFTGWAT